MFLGHCALGFAAKRVAPRTSLGTLFVAPQLADLLWPVFLLLGWEHARIVPSPNPFFQLSFDAYPLSHSLLALVVWGVLFALGYRAWGGERRAALLVGLLVVSHWVLDAVVHRPDLPLYPEGPTVGLGLWSSVRATLVVEGALFLAGVWSYCSATQPRDAVGRYGTWALVAVLVLSYLGTLFSGPPPTVGALEIGAIVVGWLFVAWAAWVDRHRSLYSS
jgi:hypothetical protein